MASTSCSSAWQRFPRRPSVGCAQRQSEAKPKECPPHQLSVGSRPRLRKPAAPRSCWSDMLRGCTSQAGYVSQRPYWRLMSRRDQGEELAGQEGVSTPILPNSAGASYRPQPSTPALVLATASPEARSCSAWRKAKSTHAKLGPGCERAATASSTTASSWASGRSTVKHLKSLVIIRSVHSGTSASERRLSSFTSSTVPSGTSSTCFSRSQDNSSRKVPFCT
mmetsp:Transcript_84255/g.223727  ORF Transcript_84255/g.223727 Transcript_84255/m.223727 type:complete len:222 (+) Transcript_84255:952-1617(+)